jgi:hypothetical protein
LCWEFSVDFEGSTRWDLPLLGVDLGIAGLCPGTVGGTKMSDGVMASAQGLFDVSSGAAVLLLVLLSVLLSRILLGSPLTAWALASPEELDPELFESRTVLEVILDVSIWSPRLGDLPLTDKSSSIQPAGVGGTGPRVDNS